MHLIYFICGAGHITYHNIHNNENDKSLSINEVNMASTIGKYIIQRLIRYLYIKTKETSSTGSNTYSEFKESLFETYPYNILHSEDDDRNMVIANIGFKFLHILKEVDMIKSKLIVNSKKEQKTIITKSMVQIMLFNLIFLSTLGL